MALGSGDVVIITVATATGFLVLVYGAALWQSRRVRRQDKERRERIQQDMPLQVWYSQGDERMILD